MAVDRPKSQRLADHGLQSERLLWPGKGPSEFERELGDILSRYPNKLAACIPVLLALSFAGLRKQER